ncbi:MAG: hypothetical protein AAFY46_15365, partial [Planctomycetota bacterium]
MMRFNRSVAVVRSSVAVSVLLSVAGAASGQAGVWTSQFGGVWTNPLNWFNGIVPNGAGASAAFPALGQYEVRVNTSPTLGDLDVANGVTLEIEPGERLSMAAGIGITNDGLLIVNRTAFDTPTYLTISGNSIIEGAGELRLNAQADVGPGYTPSPTYAELEVKAGALLTVGTEQVVAGDGIVRIDGSLDMRGVLTGDTLDVPGNVTGPLNIIGNISLNNGGVATDGVLFADGTVSGGQFTGQVLLSDGSVVDGTLFTGENRVIGCNCPTEFVSGIAAGGLINDGVLRVVEGRATLESRIDAEISGSGSLVLEDNGSTNGRGTIRASTGTVLTIGPGQTVQG